MDNMKACDTIRDLTKNMLDTNVEMIDIGNTISMAIVLNNTLNTKGVSSTEHTEASQKMAKSIGVSKDIVLNSHNKLLRDMIRTYAASVYNSLFKLRNYVSNIHLTNVEILKDISTEDFEKINTNELLNKEVLFYSYSWLKDLVSTLNNSISLSDIILTTMNGYGDKKSSTDTFANINESMESLGIKIHNFTISTEQISNTPITLKELGWNSKEELVSVKESIEKTQDTLKHFVDSLTDQFIFSISSFLDTNCCSNDNNISVVKYMNVAFATINNICYILSGIPIRYKLLT